MLNIRVEPSFFSRGLIHLRQNWPTESIMNLYSDSFFTLQKPIVETFQAKITFIISLVVFPYKS